MNFFDAARDWMILAPPSPAARQGAAELSRYIDLLRRRAGSGRKPPAIGDAAGPAPADSVPLILLNAGEGGPERNGFAWRLGEGRLEIYGDSDRGLLNGVFDFLDALGLRWPAPDREELPPPAAAYPLRDNRGRRASAPSAAELPRLIVDKKSGAKDREALARWAARNRIDALVFSLRDRRLNRRPGLPAAVEQYALITEAGGRDLSLLVPRRLFLFRRELVRMESGRRVRDLHFCPTNPETIGVLKKEAARIFRRVLDAHPDITVIHLWPGGEIVHDIDEKSWCACPACRAFSAADQYRIAVNAAADVLAELAPETRISFYEKDGEEGEDERRHIPLRPQVFKLKRPPAEA
jgi:hypothetical protein